MKTSHILLALITVITLTGMVATDVLLKQQYDRIDWSDPFQDFERRAVPTARHWVIEGNPDTEIMVQQQPEPQALVRPDLYRYYSTRQQGDTAFVTFTLDYKGQNNPRTTTNELPTGLVLHIPDLQSLRVRNGRLTLRKLTPVGLVVDLRKSRLRTGELSVAGPFTLTVWENSEAILGADRYTALRADVRDSSSIQLNNTQADAFMPNLSPKAEVQLRGRATQWLTGRTGLSGGADAGQR